MLMFRLFPRSSIIIGDRLTPEALKDVPEEYEDVTEEDGSGVPGWLKGLFILVISLLLGAMTFYAVASDVIGEIF